MRVIKRAAPLITLAAALTLGACAAPAAQPTAAPPPQATMALASTAAPNPTVELPSAPALSLGVTASGEIEALRSADLSFRVPGTVGEVLVEEGDQVSAGQPLARLDIRELTLQVTQAEASLAQAQANYERLVEGATPEDIAAARAQVAQAQAGLTQARGGVTAADIAAAEAALEQAKALEARLLAGPETTDLQQAQAGLDQARANLAVQRTNLSAAKTNAELQVGTAANALRDAQQAYSDIYWQNRELENTLRRFGRELPDEAVAAEEQALRRVQNAEAALAQARLGYEQAVQNEIDGLAAANAQVANAEAALQRVRDGATTDQLAGARAQVASAQANLERLRGEQRQGSIASAQAGLQAAQANLARVLADPTQATLAGALAQVRAAEAAVEAARLNLEKATLTAPFAGIVSIVGIDEGDSVTGAPGIPAVQIVDVSELRVTVSIADTDVARVREGQRAEVTVDALAGTPFSGVVTYIAPTATVVGTIRTFVVRITLDDQSGLRAGMSARVRIIVE